MSPTPIKMLVADDSRTILRMFRLIADRSPGAAIELVAAENGRDCLTLLERGDIHLAFIDVNMPDMSGIEALDAARSNGSKTFVTLMSTETSEPNNLLARKLNVYEFLEKPFSIADVEAIIAIYRRLTAPMRALIVDDWAVTRKVIRKVLLGSIFNIDVHEARDGPGALAACQTNSFDVVFLDCNMPGLDGLQTLDLLLGRDPMPYVIMISAQRDEQRTREAVERGAAAFLHKPFFPADIDRTLHRAFGLRAPKLTAADPA
jgi:CheY-like chemotaxis protein